MTALEPAPVVGLCLTCGRPVRRGDERVVSIEQGSGAGPDVLLHRVPCTPAYVRRHN